MKNSIPHALSVLLVAAVVRAQPMIADGKTEPWFASIQHAAQLSRMGEFRDAIANYRALLTDSTTAGNVQLRAYVLSQMADAEIELGDSTAAEAEAREAVSILSSSNQTKVSTFAVAQDVLANALRAEGNYGEAKRLAEAAVFLGKQTLDPLSPRLGILVTTLGLILQESGQLRPALVLCKQALTIFAKAGEGYKIDLGTAYQNLAVVYMDMGKPKRALESVNLALTTWSEILPSDHSFVVYALSTKLCALTKLRAFKEAAPMVPRMLSLGLSSFGPNHPERVILLNNAAALYIAEKKYSEAEHLLAEAVTLGKRLYPSGHPLTRHMLEGHAFVLAKLNRMEDASRARAESEMLLAFPRQNIPTMH